MKNSYDPGKDDAEAAASRERALIQSLRKWTHLATVPAKDLKEQWEESGCCLCARYRHKCQKRKVCPLSLINQDCMVGGSLWRVVLNAYWKWEGDKTLANFVKYRFRARLMVRWLTTAYSKLYPGIDRSHM